jgi:hypothetical protein
VQNVAILFGCMLHNFFNAADVFIYCWPRWVHEQRVTCFLDFVAFFLLHGHGQNVATFLQVCMEKMLQAMLHSERCCKWMLP